MVLGAMSAQLRKAKQATRGYARYQDRHAGCQKSRQGPKHTTCLGQLQFIGIIIDDMPCLLVEGTLHTCRLSQEVHEMELPPSR